MSDTKLLLWDIDGTLVHTGKAGEFAMTGALRKRFRVDGDVHQVDFRGRTDGLICRMLLEFHGIPTTPENVHDFMETYLELLQEELPKREGTVFPGIIRLLEICAARPDTINALLTGNLQRGAQFKLSHYQVWHFFEFGAFADDSHIRNELGPVALKRALEKTGLEIPPSKVVVIGDTPHDIACGRAIGARTIAVATGGYTKEQLLEHKPDAYFDDFSNETAFLAFVDSM